jgi:hypothetical protein
MFFYLLPALKQHLGKHEIKRQKGTKRYNTEEETCFYMRMVQVYFVTQYTDFTQAFFTFKTSFGFTV